jgi:hypothetical protein
VIAVYLKAAIGYNGDKWRRILYVMHESQRSRKDRKGFAEQQVN